MGHDGMVSSDLRCKVCEPDTELGEPNSRWHTQAAVDAKVKDALWQHELANGGCVPADAYADLGEAYRDLRHKIDGVRFRLLDRRAHATEGPTISRIRVESWLREILEDGE